MERGFPVSIPCSDHQFPNQACWNTVLIAAYVAVGAPGERNGLAVQSKEGNR